MFDMIVGFAIGLMVGWNVLPQPQWMKDKYQAAVKWMYSQFTGNGK